MSRVVLRLDNQNALSVTAPFLATDQQLVGFVSKHITAFVKKQRTRERNAKLDLSKRIIALYGKAYVLKPVKCFSARKQRLEFIADSCYVHVQILSEERIEQIVKKGYVAMAKVKLAEDVRRLSKLTEVSPDSLVVKWVTGKWGHWQNNKRQMLLAAQLLLHEQSVIDYVIVHEMAHSLHQNHGKQFWAQVGLWHADYQQARRSLRDEDV